MRTWLQKELGDKLWIESQKKAEWEYNHYYYLWKQKHQLAEEYAEKLMQQQDDVKNIKGYSALIDNHLFDLAKNSKLS